MAYNATELLIHALKRIEGTLGECRARIAYAENELNTAKDDLAREEAAKKSLEGALEKLKSVGWTEA